MKPGKPTQHCIDRLSYMGEDWAPCEKCQKELQTWRTEQLRKMSDEEVLELIRRTGERLRSTSIRVW